MDNDRAFTVYALTLIAAVSSVITACVLGALVISKYKLGMSNGESVSVSFLTLAFAQIFHVFNMRDAGSPLINNEVTRNPYVWGALPLCALIVLVAVFVPPVAHVLGITDPGAQGWKLIAAASLTPFLLGQVLKHVTGK